nr:hypothetical protein [Tanacetum cinerariifolium]
MTCPTDIAAYNKIRSENKLFQFLNALDRKYDPIKREILRWDPLPTAEAAYATVRKETAHRNILGGKQQGVTSGVKLTDDLDGIGFVSKAADQTKSLIRHHLESIKLRKSGKAVAAVGSQETIDSSSDSNTHQKGIGVEKYPSNPSSQNSTLFFENPQEELETPSTSREVNMATSGKKMTLGYLIAAPLIQ